MSSIIRTARLMLACLAWAILWAIGAFYIWHHFEQWNGDLLFIFGVCAFLSLLGLGFYWDFADKLRQDSRPI